MSTTGRSRPSSGIGLPPPESSRASDQRMLSMVAMLARAAEAEISTCSAANNPLTMPRFQPIDRASARLFMPAPESMIAVDRRSRHEKSPGTLHASLGAYRQTIRHVKRSGPPPPQPLLHGERGVRAPPTERRLGGEVQNQVSGRKRWRLSGSYLNE